MSADFHITALQERHNALDREIAEQGRRPGPNDLQIRELKREKLRLKDEIAKAHRDPSNGIPSGKTRRRRAPADGFAP